MEDTNRPFRTLIYGTLRQQAGLNVGGTDLGDVQPDTCHRDGLQRLTIPGTSFAGAMIETATRLFPDLIPADPRGIPLLERRVTGKQPGTPQAKRRRVRAGEEFLQSVWRFRNAHPSGKVLTEWRQGVGIRQATGASAGQKRALYDFEVVPTGTTWSFFLEIDTFRGGVAAEWLAVQALDEWRRGYGWLGRGPARGTGWFCLESPELVRIPLTSRALRAWPHNQLSTHDNAEGATNDKSPARSLPRLLAAGARPVDWAAAALAARQATSGWQRGAWHYLSITVTLGPDPSGATEPDHYGLDVLQVGGHPALELHDSSAGMLQPLSVQNYGWRGAQYQRPDSPLVTTRPADASGFQPFLPGSGIRGPLRHTVSRLANAKQRVRDPNWKDDPLVKELATCVDLRKHELRKSKRPAFVPDAEVRHLVERELGDRVTALFGAEEVCGRILVRDAELVGSNFTVVRAEHHAEDEFTAGVYGGAKFNRDVLVAGRMRFQIVLEAPTREALGSMVRLLGPAFELARLGFLPIGGGKWRGAGWLPWTLESIELSRAGEDKPIGQDTEATKPFPDRVQRWFPEISGAADPAAGIPAAVGAAPEGASR